MKKFPPYIQGFKNKRLNFFLKVAGCILCITGIAKIITLTGDTGLLDVEDPIFRIPFKYLMFIIGVVEIIIAALCFFSNQHMFALLLVASISSGFLVYRIGMYLVDWERPCGCLGNLTDVLGMSPKVAGLLSICLLGYLLLGSYSFIVYMEKSSDGKEMLKL